MGLIILPICILVLTDTINVGWGVVAFLIYGGYARYKNNQNNDKGR